MAYQIILSTCPDMQSARHIADHLVQDKLVACVNILPGLTSVYPWKGEIESAQEHMLIMKTQQKNYDQIEALICQKHPYELPEIIAVPVDRGFSEYLQWIDTCLS